MRRRALLAAWVFVWAWVFLSALPAQNHSGERPEVHFTFAVPNFDSTISLGIFNAEGRLVRKLAEGKPERDFLVGLNGLVAYWDGQDDAGAEVPPGVYEVRGFAVGTFQEEVEAVLGNEWWSSLGADLAPVEIDSLGVGPSGSLILLGRTAAAHTVLLSPDPESQALRWSQVLPQETTIPPVLAQPTDEWVVLLGANHLLLLDAATGQVIARGAIPMAEGGPFSVAIHDGVLHVLDASGMRHFALLGLQEQKVPEETARPPSRLRWRSPRLPDLALDEEGRAWIRDGSAWTVFLPEDNARFAAIVPGKEGRFWALVRQGITGVFRVGQFNLQGDFLKQVDPETFAGQPRALAVSDDEKTIFVLATLPGPGSEVVGFRHEENEEGAGWKIFFHRSIAPAAVEEEENYRPLPIRLKLELASALGRGREATTFRLLHTPEGRIELQTPEGLVVAVLLQRPQIFSASVAVDPARPNALRLQLQQTGRSERVVVLGLERISRLGIGDIRWPAESPGAPKAPDQP